MYRYLISIISFLIIFFSGMFNCANAKVFVSLIPGITEIMYKIGAQDSLIGISTSCTYPPEAKSKEIIGDTFFLNKEKIIRMHPDYILALDTSRPLLTDLYKTPIKPVFFEFKNINDIYSNILILGKLTEKEENAKKLVSEIKSDIKKTKTKQPKKILYLVQTNPMITIGNKSFVSDIIEKSGQISVTKSINSYYPSISTEFAIKSKPDIVLVSFCTDIEKLKKLFPESKIVFLNKYEQDIINRTGPRVNQAVKYFASF